MILGFIFFFLVGNLWIGLEGAAIEQRSTTTEQTSSETVEKQFLTGIENNSRKFNTINCNFHQTKQHPYLKNPAKSTGKFQYKNGRVSIIYNEPQGDCIIMDEKECQTIVNGKSQIISTHSQPALKQIYQIIQASVSGNMKMIFDVFNVDISENNCYDLQHELKRKHPKLALNIIIGSVRDSRKIFNLMETFQPQIVYHAAAHKHVPLMEDSPCEAIKNNAMGTYKTAYAAMVCNCERFVLISSDKAVNPTNIMGASKRLCEMVIQAFDYKIKNGLPENHRRSPFSLYAECSYYLKISCWEMMRMPSACNAPTALSLSPTRRIT